MSRKVILTIGFQWEDKEAEKDLLETKNSRKEIEKCFLKSKVFLISDGLAD